MNCREGRCLLFSKYDIWKTLYSLPRFDVDEFYTHTHINIYFFGSRFIIVHNKSAVGQAGARNDF